MPTTYRAKCATNGPRYKADFVDLIVNTAGEEQIDLISRAIESDHRPKKPGAPASAVAKFSRRDRPRDAERLAATLEACWPLHPVVACLLGPISRRRFGQNQRSIFGFLNSAEPHGFQDFLNQAFAGETVRPGSALGLPTRQP